MASETQAYAGFCNEPAYGSMIGDDFLVQKAAKKDAWKTHLLQVALAFFVPWLVFIIVLPAMSFSLRYWHPEISWLVFAICLLAVLATGGLSFSAALKGRDSTWFMILTGLMIVALVLGTCFGDLNFRHNIQPYQDAMRLNAYMDVDPNTKHGNEVMDAGQITFDKDVGPDLHRAMGFRNQDMYCVTPIVNRKLPDNPEGRYEFWAVGTNCCSGNPDDFHCGEYDNPYAHSGLRAVSEYTLPYYKLAVKQAEAAYNIKAPHPVFFTWLQDPADELAATSATGMHYYVVGLYSYLIGQIVVVGACALFLTKLGPWFMGAEH